VELEHFMQCVLEGSTPLCSDADGILALCAAQAGSEAAGTGRKHQVKQANA
jgi:predicted dehydrogenase